MFTQLFASGKRVVKFQNDVLLFFGQLVRIGRVDGGEQAVAQRIFRTVDGDSLLFEVDVMKQHTVFHLEFRAAAYNLSFQFELDNADSLMHLCYEAYSLIVICARREIYLRCEAFAWVVGIGFHGESSQRQQVDAVTIFKRREVSVAHGHTQNVGYAAVIARCGSHPQDVVVSPLYIEVMIVAQRIHDDVRTGTTVEYIAQDMQRVDGEALYQVTQSHYEIIGTVSIYYGTYNYIDIRLFVGVHTAFVQ